jgi:hypothetical protein
MVCLLGSVARGRAAFLNSTRGCHACKFPKVENFGVLGYIIIGIFLVAWLGSVVFCRFKRYDDLGVNTVGGL